MRGQDLFRSAVLTAVMATQHHSVSVGPNDIRRYACKFRQAALMHCHGQVAASVRKICVGAADCHVLKTVAG